MLLLVALSLQFVGTKAFAPRGVVHDILSPSTLTKKATIFDMTTFKCTSPPLSSSSSSSSRLATHLYSTQVQEDEDEEEWHPIDMAQTTPQLLSALWFLIAQGSTMVKGESSTLIFPKMQDKFSPSYLNRLRGHLDSCKDVCDFFGTKTVLVPHVDKLGKMTGFTVKSYRNPETTTDDEQEFPYDPFWDDGDDWNHEGIDDEEEGKSSLQQDDYPEIVDKVPDDNEKIIEITKTWVEKMMSDMGICPFTSGSNMAGLPMGPVFYTVERCTQMEDMYARYWKEVVRVERNPEKDLSTTLLIAPEFCLDNIELFENFSNTLTQPLTALGIDDLLQLVFFHPQWTFRDGGERSGTGAAANYARRSPWPMINVLRTKQVRAAQRGIPTGLVYQQNEKTLTDIGANKLEVMLRLRDWSDISDIQVNRRDMEALRVAQDYQHTGTISAQDMSFEYDSTPAANKVNPSQIEGGSLVNVLRDALEKRLGLNDGSTTITPLSGPETSATVMASDFLLQELNRIAESTTSNEPTTTRIVSEAERMILQDMEPPNVDEREELKVLFGGGGIPMGRDDDDDNFTGVNPNSFY
jgi:hypothetical protein